MTMHFKVESIPPAETISHYIQGQTQYEPACQQVRSKFSGARKIELDMVDTDVSELRQCVLDIIEQYGYSGWRHKDGESKTYGGFSLTYNPDHQDGIDPHVSSIGTPKNASDEFFWATTGTHRVLKHSYFDTYGFRVRTPASKIGALGRFIDSFKRPLVRSRVGIIPGENIDPNDAEYKEKDGWHRDEPVFENLRINIPLQTDDSYLFQMEGEEPYHLEVGTAYTWDTHIAHRVFAAKRTKLMRIHLVLGVSPWFDYDPAQDSWMPNDYLGRIHPFDMLAEGLISDKLRVRS
jgi:hypothetical protein